MFNFKEIEPKTQQLRNYCPLQCQNAKFAYIWSHSPKTTTIKSTTILASTINICEKNVERRRTDWLFWRSAGCYNFEAQYDIGCVFEESIKIQQETYSKYNLKKRNESNDLIENKINSDNTDLINQKNNPKPTKLNTNMTNSTETNLINQKNTKNDQKIQTKDLNLTTNSNTIIESINQNNTKIDQKI